MNSTQTIYAKNPAPLVKEELATCYKIYVGFEKDRTGEIVALEIIDGYLQANESIKFIREYQLETGVSCFEVDIVPSAHMNTYLRLPIHTPLLQTILVKAFKNGKYVGFQWIDQEGTIQGTPERGISLAGIAKVIN